MIFVGRLRRQYGFSVDSFQIPLDSYLNFAGSTENFECSTSCFPTVTIQSLTGDIGQARFVKKFNFFCF